MARCVLQFTVSVNQDWLSVSPASGLINENETVNLTVSYNTANLPVGRHTALITITADLAANSPQVVAVILDVTSIPATPQSGNAKNRRHKWVRKYPQPIEP